MDENNTGCKDRNNEDICNGDIIQCVLYPKNLLKVAYEDGKFKGLSVSGYMGVSDINVLNLNSYVVIKE